MTTPALCVCGHVRGLHMPLPHDPGWFCRDRDLGHRCDCARYKAAPRLTGKARLAHRNRRKSGRAFENEVAEAYAVLWGAQRRGGVGEPDVEVYGPDAEPLMEIECEHAIRAGSKAQRDAKYTEAERLARGQRGAPLPGYAFRVKGDGQSWICRKLEDDIALLRRLVG